MRAVFCLFPASLIGDGKRIYDLIYAIIANIIDRKKKTRQTKVPTPPMMLIANVIGFKKSLAISRGFFSF